MTSLQQIVAFWEELQLLRIKYRIKSICVTTNETCEARLEDETYVELNDSKVPIVGKN